MIEDIGGCTRSATRGVGPRPPKERILTGRMAEAMDCETGDSARNDFRRPQPPIVSRPCPLCGEAIEVPEKRGLQSAECRACGLHCTVDASPPTVALDARLLEPIVSVSPDVEHWLQRPPQPVAPERTLEARRARRRRALAVALGGLLSASLAAAAALVGYQQANENYARQLAEQREQAAETEAHLLVEKERLERDRQLAEQTTAAAEREVRLMTARYLAAQAKDTVLSHPWRSVSTAIDAINSTLWKDGFASPEAHQSLRDALARCPAVYELDGVALPGRAGSTGCLAASLDGRWLAAAAAGNSVRLWDLQLGAPGNAKTLLKEHSAPVTHLLFAPDSRRLIAACEDSTTSVWDLTDGTDRTTRIVLPGRDGPIAQMTLSADGRWLAIVFAGSGGKGETARLWDLVAGPQQATSLELDGHGRRIQAVAISADSRWLALGVDDTVHMWNLAAKVPAVASVGRQCGHGEVTAALFTNDGKWLVTAGRDGSARLWNLAADDPSTSIELRGHRSPVHLLTASDDGRWLATASNDRTLKVWDLHAANPATPIELPTIKGEVANLDFSRDGKWLAASDSNGGVRLWAMSNEGPNADAVVIRASRKPCSVAFTANSRWLAAAGCNSAVRLWNVDLHDLINRAAATTRARCESIAFRYAWLAPSQTIAGRIITQQIGESIMAVVGRSLAPHVGRLHSKATQLAAAAARRWEEIQPELAQRMAAATANTAPCAPITQPAPQAPKPAAPRTATSRFEIPRRSTQGNTLRLYVN
jgi:WD40 repeat protein